MSERRDTPIILRMLADEVEANHALTQALETARAATVNASKHGLLEICRLDSLLQMTADEARALAADLDWLQERWMDAESANADVELSFREYIAAIEKREKVLEGRLDVQLNANQGLLDRISEMESLDRQAVIRADEQAGEIARLERELAASQAAHAATCEAWRNDKDFRAHTAPKAPSVPRRAAPGVEVEF